MILPGAEKTPDKIQHPFMVKTLKLQIEGNFLTMFKGIYGKPASLDSVVAD